MEIIKIAEWGKPAKNILKKVVWVCDKYFIINKMIYLINLISCKKKLEAGAERNKANLN